jgi:hypothetical protein
MLERGAARVSIALSMVSDRWCGKSFSFVLSFTASAADLVPLDRPYS